MSGFRSSQCSPPKAPFGFSVFAIASRRTLRSCCSCLFEVRCWSLIHCCLLLFRVLGSLLASETVPLALVIQSPVLPPAVFTAPHDHRGNTQLPLSKYKASKERDRTAQKYIRTATPPASPCACQTGAIDEARIAELALLHKALHYVCICWLLGCAVLASQVRHNCWTHRIPSHHLAAGKRTAHHDIQRHICEFPRQRRRQERKSKGRETFAPHLQRWSRYAFHHRGFRAVLDRPHGAVTS